MEVWQGLAAVYTSLKQWSDAEICLEKAQALKAYSAETWHSAGASLVSNLLSVSNRGLGFLDWRTTLTKGQ